MDSLHRPYLGVVIKWVVIVTVLALYMKSLSNITAAAAAAATRKSNNFWRSIHSTSWK